MIERESGRVVGDIGFLGPPDESASVEIGYCVIPDRRRRGYASEAARALVGWVLEQPGVEVVVASPESGNLASVRTLERVGFQRASQVGWRYAGPNEER